MPRVKTVLGVLLVAACVLACSATSAIGADFEAKTYPDKINATGSWFVLVSQGVGGEFRVLCEKGDKDKGELKEGSPTLEYVPTYEKCIIELKKEHKNESVTATVKGCAYKLLEPSPGSLFEPESKTAFEGQFELAGGSSCEITFSGTESKCKVTVNGQGPHMGVIYNDYANEELGLQLVGDGFRYHATECPGVANGEAEAYELAELTKFSGMKIVTLGNPAWGFCLKENIQGGKYSDALCNNAQNGGQYTLFEFSGIPTRKMFDPILMKAPMTLATITLKSTAFKQVVIECKAVAFGKGTAYIAGGEPGRLAGVLEYTGCVVTSEKGCQVRGNSNLIGAIVSEKLDGRFGYAEEGAAKNKELTTGLGASLVALELKGLGVLSKLLFSKLIVEAKPGETCAVAGEDNGALKNGVKIEGAIITRVNNPTTGELEHSLTIGSKGGAVWERVPNNKLVGDVSGSPVIANKLGEAVFSGIMKMATEEAGKMIKLGWRILLLP